MGYMNLVENIYRAGVESGQLPWIGEDRIYKPYRAGVESGLLPWIGENRIFKPG